MNISSFDIPSSIPLQPPQPLFVATTKTDSLVFRAVRWFKGEGQSDTVIFWRKVAAVALAILLAISLIGIPFLIEGFHLWNHRNKISMDSELPPFFKKAEESDQQDDLKMEMTSKKIA